MMDTITRKPLYVSTDGDAGPYIMVPVAQLERVRALLDANKVPYWVDEEAISLDGKPEIAVINLGDRSDPEPIQHLLDKHSLKLFVLQRCPARGIRKGSHDSTR